MLETFKDSTVTLKLSDFKWLENRIEELDSNVKEIERMIAKVFQIDMDELRKRNFDIQSAESERSISEYMMRRGPR